MRLIWLIGFFLVAATSLAQPNPFELRHYLSPEERQRILFSERNPFELIRGEEAAAIRDFLPGPAQSEAMVQALEDRRYLEAPGLMFWIYLGLFVFLTILFSIGRSLLGRMTRALLNDQLSISLLRERQRTQATPYLLWYLFFLLNAGVFLYQAINWRTAGDFPGDAPLWIIYLGAGVLVYYLSKHLILEMYGRIFPVWRMTRPYSFAINLYNAILGVALFPVNVALSYSGGGFRDAFVYGAIAIIGVSYLLRILRGLWIALPAISRYPVHFFIYLCAVEIGPILLLLQAGGQMTGE